MAAPSSPASQGEPEAIDDQPDGPAVPPRSGMQRVDERKVGSVESLPPPDPAADVAGFVEPAENENVDAPQPPLLE